MQGGVYVALDVQYNDPTAKVCGVMFKDPSTFEVNVRFHTVNHVEPYESGAFYKRELPCLMELLRNLVQEGVQIKCLIIDGYVRLGVDQHDGLGMHLYRAMGESIPVIGVAKTLFKGTPDTQLVYRAGSSRPLAVTAVGMDEGEARTFIQNMHGDFRLPTVLKYVDSCCRDNG